MPDPIDPSARQVVLCLPDEDSTSGTDWGRIGTFAAAGLLLTVGGVVGLAAAGLAAGYRIATFGDKPTASGDRSVLVCHKKDLARFTFEAPATLKYRLPYGLHPHSETRYIGLPGFHQALFQEKISDFMTLLAGLGAARCKVSAKSGMGTHGDFEASFAPPKKGPKIDVGFDASSRRGATVEASFEEHYAHASKPVVPPGLAWYSHEPTWRALARRRIDYGLKEFAISVVSEADYGINGGLVAKLEGIGAAFDGKYRDFERTEWLFEGEFH